MPSTTATFTQVDQAEEPVPTPVLPKMQKMTKNQREFFNDAVAENTSISPFDKENVRMFWSVFSVLSHNVRVALYKDETALDNALIPWLKLTKERYYPFLTKIQAGPKKWQNYIILRAEMQLRGTDINDELQLTDKERMALHNVNDADDTILSLALTKVMKLAMWLTINHYKKTNELLPEVWKCLNQVGLTRACNLMSLNKCYEKANDAWRAQWDFLGMIRRKCAIRPALALVSIHTEPKVTRPPSA